ncbi:MAG: hypothetical protein A2381_14690 [Bdellovibrionales bacterium RIFOXYB1_FULL_37_110]|nr:MAG: hypothetical protein A2417_05175 [Bdellovibrionales bacterium RIFOXYC1_FULL_37_79]OFZ57482.1 MAG: hypothetical protein A2381_14690 [Bdellovibrionales bacterium RIFOXYB1_FULL_37_110]OFZ62714.1 MAG: hypothetical protein A2577_17010 [Bdellovibrionales bacterium RIFOXYD1_FULL_36_51]
MGKHINVFKHLDYRKIIKESLIFFHREDKKYTITNMAKFIRVQNPYVSKILNGDASFNQDQMYLVCRYFSFDSDQRNFLSLLLEYDRSTLIERKKKILEEINTLRNKYRDSSRHIAAKKISTDTNALEKYYSNPLIQIIHICLTIEKYCKNPQDLSNKLRISEGYLNTILESLEEMNLIRKNEKGYQVLERNIHLPKGASILKVHQNLVRMKSIEHYNSFSSKEDYFFNVTFSTDEETKIAIHEEFLIFLKKVEELVKKSNPTGVYQLNFDLLSWLDT